MMLFEESTNKLLFWFLAVLSNRLTLCDHPSISSGTPDEEIISLRETSIRDAPYIVALKIELIDIYDKSLYYMLCAGTIISRQWVITGAHCILKEYDITKRVSIIMGVDGLLEIENMPQRNGDIPRADLWHCHPNFSTGMTFDPVTEHYTFWDSHDICLLRIDHNLQFGEYINRAVLPWDALDQDITNKKLIEFRHGRLNEDGDNFEKLKSIYVKFLPGEECTKMAPLYFMPEQDFCTEYFDKFQDEMSCSDPSWDHGGGIVYIDSITNCPVLRGILKGGHECVFLTHSNLFLYKDWILETMERFHRPRDNISYIYPPRNRE